MAKKKSTPPKKPRAPQSSKRLVRGAPSQKWNPTTEPARSVKRVLIKIGARAEVLPGRTIGELGLSRYEVQVAMNTEFFAGTNKRLSTEQCAEDVMVLTLVGTIADLHEA